MKFLLNKAAQDISNPADAEKKSILMIVLSMLIFGTVGIFRKFIFLPSEWIAFTRGLLGGMYLLIQAKARGEQLQFRIPKSSLLLLGIAGTIMGVNWILLFESYSYTTIAIATLCYYMQPIIMILLSPLVFKEKLTAKKMICATLALLGMTFVSGIFSGQIGHGNHNIGILLGIGAAFLYAVTVMLNKKIPDVPANERTVLQLFTASVVLVPYLLFRGLPRNISIDLRSVVLLLIVSVFHTGFAYALYFQNIPKLKTQTIAILSFIDPVSALFFSAFFLKERMDGFAMFGAILIIGAAFFAEVDWGKRAS